MSAHLLADAAHDRVQSRASLERRLKAVDAMLAATEHVAVSRIAQRRFLQGERNDLHKRLRDLDQVPMFPDAREMFP